MEIEGVHGPTPKTGKESQPEEHVIPQTYISGRLRELLMDPHTSVGVNYRKELRRIVLCFSQYLLTMAHQICVEKGDREVGRKHVEAALEEANFGHFCEKLAETVKVKPRGVSRRRLSRPG